MTGETSPREYGERVEAQSPSQASENRGHTTSSLGHALLKSASRPWIPLVLHFLLCIVHFRYVVASPLLDHLVIDLSRYAEWAREIAAGNWLGQQVFYQDPLYPYFMAVCFRFLGPGIAGVLLVQIAAGLLTVFGVFRLSHMLFGPRCAKLSMWVAALFLPSVYYQVMPEKAALSAMGLTWALVFLCQGLEKPSWWRFAILGCILGLVSLMRANALLLAISLVAALPLAGLQSLRPGKRFVMASAHLFGLALALMPVCLRNYWVGGEWVLTTAQAGPNLYIGNNPLNEHGSYTTFDFVRAAPPFEQIDFHRHAEHVTGRVLSPSEASNFYVREVIHWATKDPLAFLRLQLIKCRAFLHAYEIPDNWSMQFVGEFSPLMHWPLIRLGWIMPWVVLGLILALLNHLTRAPGMAAGLLIIYALSVIAFFVFSRYRYPMLPAAIPFAVHGLLCFFSWLRQQAWLPASGGVFLVGGLYFLAYAGEPIPRQADFSHRFYNLAQSLFQDGDLNRARAMAEKAIQIHAQNPFAELLLHRIALLQAHPVAARQHLDNALAMKGNRESALIYGMRWQWKRKGVDAARTWARDHSSWRDLFRLRRAWVEMALLSGETTAGLDELRAMLKDYPLEPWTLDKLCATLAQQEKWRELERLLSDIPEDRIKPQHLRLLKWARGHVEARELAHSLESSAKADHGVSAKEAWRQGFFERDPWLDLNDTLVKAMYFLQQGAIYAAQEVLESAISQGVETSKHCKLLANIASHYGDSERVEYWLERALQLSPDDAITRKELIGMGADRRP